MAAVRARYIVFCSRNFVRNVLLKSMKCMASFEFFTHRLSVAGECFSSFLKLQYIFFWTDKNKSIMKPGPALAGRFAWAVLLYNTECKVILYVHKGAHLAFFIIHCSADITVSWNVFKKWVWWGVYCFYIKLEAEKFQLNPCDNLCIINQRSCDYSNQSYVR